MFARFRTNIFEYGKTIANDYKTVFVDAFVEARRKPVKAMLISACLCGLGYAYKTNPSERLISFYPNPDFIRMV